MDAGAKARLDILQRDAERKMLDPLRRHGWTVTCQFASNHDPLFAFNRDPCEVLGLGLSM
jgi:hypothetical protein